MEPSWVSGHVPIFPKAEIRATRLKEAPECQGVSGIATSNPSERNQGYPTRAIQEAELGPPRLPSWSPQRDCISIFPVRTTRFTVGSISAGRINLQVNLFLFRILLLIEFIGRFVPFL